MPLHRNESGSCKTISLKDDIWTYVKENTSHMRERSTVFTQVASDPNMKLAVEFCFKGVGKKVKLNPPPNCNVHWAERGSYR